MIKYIFAALVHTAQTLTFFLLSPKIAVVLGQKNTKWKWQFSGKSISSSGGEWIVVLQHGFPVFCAILPLYRETTDIRRPVHVFGFTLVQAKNKWLMVFEMNLEIFWCTCCAHWRGVYHQIHILLGYVHRKSCTFHIIFESKRFQRIVISVVSSQINRVEKGEQKEWVWKRLLVRELLYVTTYTTSVWWG